MDKDGNLTENDYKFNFKSLDAKDKHDTKAWLYQNQFIKLNTTHEHYILRHHLDELRDQYGSKINDYIENDTCKYSKRQFFLGWALKYGYVRLSLKHDTLTVEYTNILTLVNNTFALNQIISELKKAGFTKNIVFNYFTDFDFETGEFTAPDQSVTPIDTAI